MNIFASYPDPVTSAKVLDDGRVNKMITESLQMIAVVMHKYGVPHEFIPTNASMRVFSARAHAQHPCTIWAGKSGTNFMWLVEHTRALCGEFERRYGKPQRGAANTDGLENALPYLPIGDLTPFPNCTTFKYIEDVHAAYKHALLDKWVNKKPKYKQTWYGSTTFPGWP